MRNIGTVSRDPRARQPLSSCDTDQNVHLTDPHHNEPPLSESSEGEAEKARQLMLRSVDTPPELLSSPALVSLLTGEITKYPICVYVYSRYTCVCTVEYRCVVSQHMMFTHLCSSTYLTPSPFSPYLMLLDLALATRQSRPGLARLIVDWLRRVCDDVMANNRMVLQQCSFGGGGILPFLVLLNTANDGDNHNHKRNDTALVGGGGGGGGTTPTHRLQVTFCVSLSITTYPSNKCSPTPPYHTLTSSNLTSSSSTACVCSITASTRDGYIW